MKQFKPVIITAIICLVLAGALFAVFKLMPDTTSNDTTTPTAPGDNTIYIIQKSAAAVKQVDVETDWGEKFTIEYTIDADGNQTASLKDADSRFDYNTDDMYTLAGYVGILAAIEEIPDTEGKDADFGFKNPKRKINVSYTDNTKIELLLGADSPLGEGVYIKRVDTDKVYLIGGSTTEMLMKSLNDYRIAKLFDKISDISSILEVKITRDGEEPITIVRNEDAEPVTDDNPVSAQYNITTPVQAEGNNQPVEERVLTPLTEIEVKETVVEDDPEDLAKYGLDKPVHVEFKIKPDKTYGFKIGGKSEAGGRYVMPDDSPTVLETEEDIPFVDIKHTDLMMQLLWLHNMDEVSQIDYRLPDGSTHTLKLDVNGDTINASYDNGTITRENASNLFLLTVRFQLQGAMDSTMQYSAPEYTLTMTLKDGSKTTLQLAKINERQYAAIVDGKPAEFYVNVNEVNELRDAFVTLQNGGTIPDMF